MRLKEVVGRMRLDAYQLSDAMMKIKDDAVELLRSEEVERFRTETVRRIREEADRAKAEFDRLRAIKARSLEHFVGLANRTGVSHVKITPSERRIGQPTIDGRQRIEYYTEYRTVDPSKRTILFEESHLQPLLNSDARGSFRSSTYTLTNFVTADDRLVNLRTRLPDTVVTFGFSLDDNQLHAVLEQAKGRNIFPFPAQRSYRT